MCGASLPAPCNICAAHDGETNYHFYLIQTKELQLYCPAVSTLSSSPAQNKLKPPLPNNQPSRGQLWHPVAVFVKDLTGESHNEITITVILFLNNSQQMTWYLFLPLVIVIVVHYLGAFLSLVCEAVVVLSDMVV
eukprot:scaffold94151_cov57-Attheya_sp.AAC.1